MGAAWARHAMCESALMGPQSYMRSVVDRNVIMRRTHVYSALRNQRITVDVVTRLPTEVGGTMIQLRAVITNLSPLESVWTTDKIALVVQ